MNQQVDREAILRTLAFHASWGYAPTYIQLLLSLDFGLGANHISSLDGKNPEETLDSLINEGLVISKQGRFTLKSFSDLIEDGRQKEIFFPRKLRKARLVARYLKKLPWIKSVCLCNTAALGQSQDSSDLDFLIIVKAGSIWSARFFAALPFVLLKMRPENQNVQDPVCLSFFISDKDLDLTNYTLEDDPYFRHWFLSLLPLYDDGVLSRLWSDNQKLIERHKNAIPWIAQNNVPALKDAVDCKNTNSQTNSFFLEKFLQKIQQKRLPQIIIEQANQNTNVVISDNVLKFHTKDARQKIRNQYYQICHGLNINP